LVRLGDIFSQVVDRGHDKDLPVLAVTIDGGVVRRDSLDRRFDREVDREQYLRVQPGDIAYNTMRMWQGASGIVREEGYVSPAYTVCRPASTECPEFWAYCFKLPEMIRAFRDHSQGFAKDRYRLYFHHFSSVPALRPPLPEQGNIVSILSSVHETITKTEIVIEQLQLVKGVVSRELLTRGIPGRHTELRELTEAWRLGRLAGASEVPSDWKLVHLTSVARLESGHTPSRNHPEYWNGEVPWLSLHDSKRLDSPEITTTEQSITPLGLANSSARLLPQGTVALSRTATVGKATILGREMATSQDFANYVCGEQLHNRYLLHLFRNMQAEWSRLMAGSTHKTVYMPVFRELQILLPSLDEQKRIAEVIDVLEARIASEQNYRDQLRVLKRALSAALLSGEIRVTPDPEPESAIAS
jgi:type I restriction enzyme S subunit